MSYKKITMVLSALAMMNACSSDPTVTEQGSVRDIPDGYTAVSICHSGEPEDKSAVEVLAFQQCPTTANQLFPWDEDLVMNSCPITMRVRTTFLCTQ